jgi:hypothetical protein
VELHPPEAAWNNEIVPFTATDEHKQNEQNFSNPSNESQQHPHPASSSTETKSRSEKLYFTIG